MPEKQIWKFVLDTVTETVVRVPKGYKVLTMQLQHQYPCIWVLVDPSEIEKKNISISVYNTGEPMPEHPGKHLGTFQLYEGALVRHVFMEELSDE